MAQSDRTQMTAVTVRLTPGTMAFVQHEAEARGLGFSTFVRMVLVQLEAKTNGHGSK